MNRSLEGVLGSPVGVGSGGLLLDSSDFASSPTFYPETAEFLQDNDTSSGLLLSTTPNPNGNIMGDLVTDFDKASTTPFPISPPLEVRKEYLHSSVFCPFKAHP